MPADPGDRAGSDVTIVARSAMVHEALAAAEELMADGGDAGAIDLRTVAPDRFRHDPPVRGKDQPPP